MQPVPPVQEEVQQMLQVEEVQQVLQVECVPMQEAQVQQDSVLAARLQVWLHAGLCCSVLAMNCPSHVKAYLREQDR